MWSADEADRFAWTLADGIVANAEMVEELHAVLEQHLFESAGHRSAEGTHLRQMMDHSVESYHEA